jgi:uncharacterized protein YndB with AHSA1/START domain
MTESTQTHELEITRIFDAPRELVFRCMIEPEHLTHFWGPVGVSTPLASITIEPHAGGRFETIMVNDETGEEHPTRGVFVEVVEPEKLVWTEPSFGITSTSTFVDLGDGRTEVRIHQTDLPEQFATPEAREGFNSSLDRFAAYLATL